MKNFKSIAILIAIAAAGFAAACSDGELQPAIDGPDPGDNVVPPLIISFYATPEEIPAGGSTTLAWKVANADSVEITAEAGGVPVPFNVQSEKLEDSVPATGLTATTNFTLKAKKAAVIPPGPDGEPPVQDATVPTEPAVPGIEPPPGESSISQTITVRVIQAESVSVKAWADKDNISANDKTIVRWEASPSDATVSVKDGAGADVAPTFSGADCEETNADALATNGTPTAGPESKGCAVVAPVTTTTYTFVAEKDGNASERAVVTINVESAGPARADIEVSEPFVTSPNASVTVSWTSEPVGAFVTVTAKPAATCELPQNAAITVTTGSTTCVLSAVPTEFRIEVKSSDGAVLADDTAEVQMMKSAGIALDIVSDQWAFAGEEVEMTIAPKAGTDRSSISEIRISGRAPITDISAEPVRVTVPRDGVTVTAVDSSGTERAYRNVVTAISMIKDDVDSAYQVTELAFDPNPSDEGKRFTGVKMANYNGGKVKIYVNGSDDWTLDIETALKPIVLGAPVDGNGFVGALKTNAIAVRPENSQEIYVGATGAIMVSDDGGAKFELLVPAYEVGGGPTNYPGHHDSCRGLPQTGAPEVRDNQVVALSQICAVVIGKSGRLVFATDHGAYATNDVQKFRDRDASAALKGRGTPLAGIVTDALVCLDEDCAHVFAGSKEGVFETTNGGEAWEAFGALGKKVFSLAIAGEKIYAGTEDDIYESPTTSASFSAAGLSDKKIYSIAVGDDGPFGLTILAGTDAGVFVTRNSGATWSQVPFGEGEALAVALSSKSSGDTKKISVLVGVGSRAYSGEVVTHEMIYPPVSPDTSGAETMSKR